MKSERCAHKLLVAVVVVALDGRFLDGPVHALDLPVGRRALDLGQAVLDAVFAATHVEHMRHVERGRTIGVTGWERKLNAVVGQHGVDFVVVREEFESRCGTGTSPIE